MKKHILISVLALGTAAVANAHPLYTNFDQNRIATELHSPLADGQETVLYYGGPVLSNVKVYAVFWGSSVDATTVSDIGGFFQTFTNSSLYDWLNEYNTNIKAFDGRDGTHQAIGRGSYAGSFTITPHNVNTQMTNSDVEKEIEAQVAQGALPVPDANTIYMVYFPNGIALTLNDGSASCQSWCADHEGFHSDKYGDIAYAMMPDLGPTSACAFGCGFASSPFDDLTLVSSHELVEATTDPMCPPMGTANAFPAAWISSDQQEIGDLCATTNPASVTASPKSYVVQEEFDNATHACSSGPWASP